MEGTRQEPYGRYVITSPKAFGRLILQQKQMTTTRQDKTTLTTPLSWTFWPFQDSEGERGGIDNTICRNRVVEVSKQPAREMINGISRKTLCPLGHIMFVDSVRVVVSGV